MIYIKQYIVTAVMFFAVDILWLGVLAKGLYKRYIGHLMADKVVLGAALAFYMIYIGGLLFFVIQPALRKESFNYALMTGFIFGFITYATYDLTNMATLKDWPLMITIIDIAWGTCLGGAVSALSYVILSRF